MVQKFVETKYDPLNLSNPFRCIQHQAQTSSKLIVETAHVVAGLLYLTQLLTQLQPAPWLLEICLETVRDVLYCKVLCGCWWWPQFVVCSVGLCWEKFCFADGELSRLHFPQQISDTRQYSDTTKQPLLLLSDVSRRNEQKRLVDTSTFQVSKCGSCFIQSL